MNVAVVLRLGLDEPEFNRSRATSYALSPIASHGFERTNLVPPIRPFA